MVYIGIRCTIGILAITGNRYKSKDGLRRKRINLNNILNRLL